MNKKKNTLASHIKVRNIEIRKTSEIGKTSTALVKLIKKPLVLMLVALAAVAGAPVGNTQNSGAHFFGVKSAFAATTYPLYGVAGNELYGISLPKGETTKLTTLPFNGMVLAQQPGTKLLYVYGNTPVNGRYPAGAYDVETNTFTLLGGGTPVSLSRLAFDSAGRLYAMSNNNRLSRLNTRTGSDYTSISLSGDRIYCGDGDMAFDQNDVLVATCANTSYKITANTSVKAAPFPSYKLNGLAFAYRNLYASTTSLGETSLLKVNVDSGETTVVKANMPNFSDLASISSWKDPSLTPKELAVRNQIPLGGIFPASSFWKESLKSAPTAPDSSALVADLSSQVASRYGGTAALNAYQYNVSFYTATPEEPLYDIAFSDCQNKGYTPSGMSGYTNGIRGQFMEVPVPLQAAPSVGRDASISIYQPSTDTLWSFWRFATTPTGYKACWGGRLDNVSSSTGIFSGNWGTSASGTALEGGVVGIKEAQSGVITHELSVGLVDFAASTNLSWPASRGDGNGLGTIPLGTRFRLDPSVDINTLNLHPLAKMIAKAAQDYGLVANESSGAVAVATESGLPTKALTGVDPWDEIINGTPTYLVMKNFPWNKLQAVPQNYGQPSNTSPSP